MTEIATFNDLTHHFYELYKKGEHKQALDLLASESTRFPDYEVIATWFQMRMTALTGDAAGAIRMLEEALAREYWYHEDALHNLPDLATLQGMPEYEDLVKRCHDLRLKAIAQAKPSLTVLEPQNHPRPWPLLLLLGAGATDPDLANHWTTALDAGWLVAIPQSSQVGWFGGLYWWDDIERTTTEIQQHYDWLFEQYRFDPNCVVIAGFSKPARAALQVALGSDLKMRGFIAVEGWLGDMSIWTPIVEANRNPALRAYFIAGEENGEYYGMAAKMVELLQSHGIACQLEGTSNEYHTFPPEFEESLTRALRFIVKAE